MHPQQIVIFGGSFDPIHLGHLAVAQHLQKKGLIPVIFLPCGTPALKNPCQANPSQRLHMLKLALAHHQGFEVDERELHRPGNSYAIDTLKSFRNQWGPSMSISFIIGEDAFANLMQWHQWQSLLDYAHIITHRRPKMSQVYPKKLQEYLKSHQCKDLQMLSKTAQGYIYCMDLPDYPYASSAIKLDIQNGKKPQGLTLEVWNYIQENNLYQSN
jgi:nicotinate-nucleotide adenylyltransferase